MASEQTSINQGQVEDTNKGVATRIPVKCLSSSWVERSHLVAEDRILGVTYAWIDTVVWVIDFATIGRAIKVRGHVARIHRTQARGCAEMPSDVHGNIRNRERKDARVHPCRPGKWRDRVSSCLVTKHAVTVRRVISTLPTNHDKGTIRRHRHVTQRVPAEPVVGLLGPRDLPVAQYRGAITNVELEHSLTKFAEHLLVVVQDKEIVAVWMGFDSANDGRIEDRVVQTKIELGINRTGLSVYSSQTADALIAKGREVTTEIEVVADLLDIAHHGRCIDLKTGVEVSDSVEFRSASRESPDPVFFPNEEAPAHIEAIACSVSLQRLDASIKHGPEVGVELTGVDVVGVDVGLIQHRPVRKANLGKVAANEHTVTHLGVREHTAPERDRQATTSFVGD